MVTLTEDRRTTAHYVVSESANLYRSREQVTIASGAGKLVAGTVLGKITASGKYTAWDADATTGEEDAAAILFGPVDATSADARAVITARDTEVVAELLVWPEGTLDAAKNTQLAALSAAGIIAR